MSQHVADYLLFLILDFNYSWFELNYSQNIQVWAPAPSLPLEEKIMIIKGLMWDKIYNKRNNMIKPKWFNLLTFENICIVFAATWIITGFKVCLVSLYIHIKKLFSSFKLNYCIIQGFSKLLLIVSQISKTSGMTLIYGDQLKITQCNKLSSIALIYGQIPEGWSMY